MKTNSQNEREGRNRVIAQIIFWILLLVLIVSAVRAFGANGMMGVGRMMGPDPSSGGGAPGGGFAILTESNSPLSTESSSVLVTENHP